MDSKPIEQGLGVIDSLLKDAVKKLNTATKGMSRKELDDMTEKAKQSGVFTDEQLKDIEKFGVKL